ncbi:hypothetical protein MPLDJ20_120077 [Mesorhizobium plurifarium]|uniref:Uncharacterized protein n=1 Tax=Mesorhizobium plurifarium TaxID=69974 RepID=A0A090G0T9_MESPL|nr:hypothetical protein MPLDJ20_120077 [Mesorhizobium plurifarium]CDX49741.1 hypothetical protein MPL3365_100199 [Mesorhizobium plurifarium]
MNAGLDASHGTSCSPWRDRHEFTFTLLTALYQFLALGVRLYVPEFCGTGRGQHLVCAAAALSIGPASVRTRPTLLPGRTENR